MRNRSVNCGITVIECSTQVHPTTAETIRSDHHYHHRQQQQQHLNIKKTFNTPHRSNDVDSDCVMFVCSHSMFNERSICSTSSSSRSSSSLSVSCESSHQHLTMKSSHTPVDCVDHSSMPHLKMARAKSTSSHSLTSSSASSSQLKTHEHPRRTSSTMLNTSVRPMGQNYLFRAMLTIIFALVFSHGGHGALSFPYDDTEIIGTEIGVAGGKIALPCNITPTIANDAVTLILWYKDESTTPIYSVDARKGQSLDAARRITDENLASRSFMSTSTHPYAHLVVEALTANDAGEYACRVDFRKERTRNSVVFLKVIIPPEKPQILDSNNEPTGALIGPYVEGERLTLLCEVEGGKPTPAVTWWRESVLLDDSYEAITNSKGSVVVRNQIAIPALTRQDLMAVFTCQASNNNISQPASTAVTVDLNFRPTTVRIVNDRKALSADKESIVTCISSGSRPSATITWWLGSKRLKQAQEQVSLDGNTTTSRLSMRATIDDLGAELTCRAENAHISGSAIEDTIKLDINYAPQVTLKLGSNLRHSHIQEGNDVYFECLVRAAPDVSEIHWHFEGRELQTNTSAGIIVSAKSLVLQKVRKHQRGKYTCSGTNAEGRTESNAIHLRIQFSPVCKQGQKIIYGAARQETVAVMCEVESDPPEVKFNWSYNRTVAGHRIESASLSFEQAAGSLTSVGQYTPRSEFDYGLVYCWAENSVGAQSTPCAYSIVAAGAPDPVRNCTVVNVTEDSMRVDCLEGYDGGIKQHFQLELFDTTERNSALRANLSSALPTFVLSQLQPAHAYLLVVYAANTKGRSKELVLSAFTLAMPESMNRLAKGHVWQLNFNPVLASLIAIVAGVVLLAFIVVLLVRWRSLKPTMGRYRDKPNSNDTNGTAAAVFRKSFHDEHCDVITPAGSDSDHNKSGDLAPDISLTSSEPMTKNTDLTDDSTEKLTTSMSGNCMQQYSTNIYTPAPMGNGVKHVTWRPETPPSPPNAYMQSHHQSFPHTNNIAYMTMPAVGAQTMSATMLDQSYHHTLQSYPGTSGHVAYPEMAVTYEAGPLPAGYVLGTDAASAAAGAMLANGGVASGQYNPYGYLPAMANSSSAYGTLQNNRRVRIIPPGVGGLNSPSTSMVSPVPSLTTTATGTSSPVSLVQHRTSGPDTQGPMTNV